MMLPGDGAKSKYCPHLTTHDDKLRFWPGRHVYDVELGQLERPERPRFLWPGGRPAAGVPGLLSSVMKPFVSPLGKILTYRVQLEKQTKLPLTRKLRANAKGEQSAHNLKLRLEEHLRWGYAGGIDIGDL